MTQPTLYDIQEALCRALGVELKDKHVRRVVLTIEHNKFPSIVIEREVFKGNQPMVMADSIATVIDQYRLQPAAETITPRADSA